MSHEMENAIFLQKDKKKKNHMTLFFFLFTFNEC